MKRKQEAKFSELKYEHKEPNQEEIKKEATVGKKWIKTKKMKEMKKRKSVKEGNEARQRMKEGNEEKSRNEENEKVRKGEGKK